jgi:Tol biopolymer transport system component
MNKYIINILLIILCLLFTGCTDDIPDKIDKSLFPAPPALKVVSTTVKNQDEISPDQIISISFNNYMETINIAISGINGSLEFDSTRTSATFNPSSKLKDGAYTLTMSGKDEFGQEISPTTITFFVKSGIIASSSMIAFTSVLDGDYEIYLIKTDGSGMKQLTYNFAQDTQPAWSPNGQYITFSSDRDGSSAWNSDIFIMRSDGTGITNLTKTLVVNEYSSFWSYDSKKIGFTSDTDGFADYYVMNVDGTGIRLMDDYEYFDFKWPGEYGDYYVYEAFDGNYDILLDFFDNPKGGVNLTNNIANDRCPSWSPDGKKIVFVSDRDFNNEIYIMNADGTNQTRITRNSVDDNYPAWSPF